MIKVFLKHGRDESLRRFHPWVFSGAVAQVQGAPAEGDIVGVYSAEGQFLASGHWQVGSIAVRILSFDADPTAPDFWTDSISRALASGGHCEFRDFGVFFLSTPKARIGRNPRKPERTVAIPTHNIVRFRAGLRLREAVARLRVPEQE